MSSEVELKFQYQRKDFKSAFRLFYRHYFWTRYFWLLVVPCAWLAIGFSQLFYGNQETGFLWLGLSLVIYLVLYYRYFSVPLRKAQKVLEDQYSAHFSDDSFTVESQGIRSEIQWSAIQKILESSEVFMMFYSKTNQNYILIPKRVFPSAKESQKFKEILKKNHF